MLYDKKNKMVLHYCVDKNHYHEKPPKLLVLFDDDGETILDRFCLDNYADNVLSKLDSDYAIPMENYGVKGYYQKKETTN